MPLIAAVGGWYIFPPFFMELGIRHNVDHPSNSYRSVRTGRWVPLVFPAMLVVVVPGRGSSWSRALGLPARHGASARLVVERQQCLHLAQSRHFGKVGLMSSLEGPESHPPSPKEPHK